MHRRLLDTGTTDTCHSIQWKDRARANGSRTVWHSHKAKQFEFHFVSNYIYIGHFWDCQDKYVGSCFSGNGHFSYGGGHFIYEEAIFFWRRLYFFSHGYFFWLGSNFLLADSNFFAATLKLPRHPITRNKVKLLPMSCNLDWVVSAQLIEWATTLRMIMLRKLEVADLLPKSRYCSLFDLG